MIYFWYLLYLLFIGMCRAEAEKLSSGEDVAKFVERHIQGYEVMVFAKSYCPYCKRSRALLAQWEDSIDMYILDLDLMDQEDGALVQMELLQKTGQRTVPNIFIGMQHIGGNSDLQALHQAGQLQGLLDNASSRHA
jgi:glutaredoxin 3